MPRAPGSNVSSFHEFSPHPPEWTGFSCCIPKKEWQGRKKGRRKGARGGRKEGGRKEKKTGGREEGRPDKREDEKKGGQEEDLFLTCVTVISKEAK